MPTTAVAFNQVPLLGEHGLSPTEAAANFLPPTMLPAADHGRAAFLAGPLAERFAPRLVLGACPGVLAAGCSGRPCRPPVRAP